MTGKQIADNLRANRDKWGQFRYYHEGKYCVIGLKLHELGVPVEKIPIEEQSQLVEFMMKELSPLLAQLQRRNDIARSIDELIDYAESNASIDYPIEHLAETLKVR